VFEEVSVRKFVLGFVIGILALPVGFLLLAWLGLLPALANADPEWSKNWNALKRRDVRFSQSPAAVSLSQVSPG
jgi:hypothetical protein